MLIVRFFRRELGRYKSVYLTSVPGILVDMTVKAHTSDHIDKCSEWRRKINSVLLVEDSDTYQVMPTSWKMPNGVRMIHISWVPFIWPEPD